VTGGLIFSLAQTPGPARPISGKREVGKHPGREETRAQGGRSGRKRAAREAFLSRLGGGAGVLSVTPRADAEKRFDIALAGRVFGAALEFAAPRTLEAVTPASLTLWGLGGITALDPTLSVGQSGAVVTLLSDDIGSRLAARRRRTMPWRGAAWLHS